jgi:hypothetical protein
MFSLLSSLCPFASLRTKLIGSTRNNKLKIYEVAIGMGYRATCSTLFALTPAEVLVIANRNAPGSVELAEYYLAKREIPAQNLLANGPFSIPSTLSRSSVIQEKKFFKRKNFKGFFPGKWLGGMHGDSPKNKCR